MSTPRPPRKASPLRVLLSDHDFLVSAGTRCLLEKTSGIQFVGEAPLGTKTLAAIAHFKPHVLFVYLGKSASDDSASVQKIARKMPNLSVIVLATNTNLEYLLQLLGSGVKGILCQTSALEELERGLQTVARGEVYLSPALPANVLEGCQSSTKPWFSLENLTLRQKTILKLISEGKNTKEIAARLNLSSKTVEFHRARLMDRVGIHDVAGLVRYALRTGLVEL